MTAPGPESAVLSPDEIRSLLRECVTVVKPGETLVIRAHENWTPRQVREVHDSIQWWLECNGNPFQMLIVPGAEFAVAEPEDDKAFADRVKRVVRDVAREELRYARRNVAGDR